MKIAQVKIANFRKYTKETVIDFNDLTVFVGKNDVGKSTILEALDVFFHSGKDIIKLDNEDINKKLNSEGNQIIRITVVFDDLPLNLVIDDTNETTLEDEHLLNKDGKLEVVKLYPNAGKEKVFIKAYHPSNPDCEDLLLKKQRDLQGIIREKSIECNNQRINSVMRQAIWGHYSRDLQMQEVEIDVTKEDAKNIWDQLKKYMPLYSLFQSDRKNSDGDSEIQNPMKLAVQQIFKDSNIQQSLKVIASEVGSKLEEVADRTLEKLREMNPEIANSLKPVIPPLEKLKWEDVFKSVTISGDEDIPINKHGSGVKRLVLLNFFRAEAERTRLENNLPGIIYAIEEPETSQHLQHQKKLIEAVIELSHQQNTQIILTTHSPSIVKMLEFENLRLIKESDSIQVENIKKSNLPYPSLNEVNFLAFDESDETYHNELYGFIENREWVNDFRQVGPMKTYRYTNKNNQEKSQEINLSTYIRHQIHHPENNFNERYTNEELQQSIREMRDFITSNNENDEQQK